MVSSTMTFDVIKLGFAMMFFLDSKLIIHGKDDGRERMYVREKAQPNPNKVLESSMKQLSNPPLRFIGRYSFKPELFPLSECEGACNNHDMCEGQLMCFRRQAFEEVPGCLGRGNEGTNYCYDAATQTPTDGPEPGMPTSAPTPVPTESPTTSPLPTGSPTPAPSRGDVWHFDDADGPFDKCEGPCYEHDDCFGDLLCQDRTAYEPITGCAGAGEFGSGYCYDPSDGPVAPKLPSGSFRLREYWENGYYWQETYEETRWCLQNEGRGYMPTVQRCGSDSTRFELKYLQGEGDMIKVRGENLCLDRTGLNNVTAQPCDDTRTRQRWKGRWNSRRFDIRPVNKQGCLTQHHHPRPNERVYVQNCETAHRTDTGFWNFY